MFYLLSAYTVITAAIFYIATLLFLPSFFNLLTEYVKKEEQNIHGKLLRKIISVDIILNLVKTTKFWKGYEWNIADNIYTSVSQCWWG